MGAGPSADEIRVRENGTVNRLTVDEDVSPAPSGAGMSTRRDNLGGDNNSDDDEHEHDDEERDFLRALCRDALCKGWRPFPKRYLFSPTAAHSSTRQSSSLFLRIVGERSVTVFHH